MFAHIRNGEIIKTLSEERGWITLANGDHVSPPLVGDYGTGGDKVVPVIEENFDNSTGNVPTVLDDTGFVVEASRVYRSKTLRDMNQAELDAFNDTKAAKEADKVLGDIQRRALNVNLFLTNQLLAAHGNPALTLQQYVNLLNGPEGDGPITRQQFVNYVKARL